jgi:hypothetical protein
MGSVLMAEIDFCRAECPHWAKVSDDLFERAVRLADARKRIWALEDRVKVLEAELCRLCGARAPKEGSPDADMTKAPQTS